MRVLMHVCCAPDATTAYLRMKEKGEVVFYFYNPNIHPPREYEKRLEEVKKLSKLWNVPLIVGEYDVKSWYEDIKGYEHLGERSYRCFLCMRHRLLKTAKVAKELGFDAFSTTLPTSPNKIYEDIVRAGKDAQEKFKIDFIVEDFKKGGGYPLSVKLSKELNLYRQNYCGCIFSLKEIEKKREESRRIRREKLEKLLKDLNLGIDLVLDPDGLVLDGELLDLDDETLGKVLSLIRPRKVVVDENIYLERWSGRRNLRFGKFKVRIEVRRLTSSPI